MKNIFRLFVTGCLLATCGLVSGQKSPDSYLLDSVYSYNWSSSNWSLYLKEYLTQNSSKQPTEELFRRFNPSTSQFQDYIRVLNSYSDTISVPTTITDQFWYSSTWNTFQYQHYQSRNLPDTTYSKNWNNQQHKFTYGLMYTYQYNTSQLPLVSLTMGLDTATQGWYNIAKTTNTYTTLMKPLEQILFSWQKSTSFWDSIVKYVNAYDSNNFLVSNIEYTWNVASSDWINAVRTTYFNNPTSLPYMVMKETWDTALNVWDTVQRSLYYYSQQNWLLTVRTQNYNQTSKTWMENYLTFYTYNPLGVQNSMTGDIWDTVHLTYITNAYQITDSATGKIAESYTRYVDPQTFLITGGILDTFSYVFSTGDSLKWLNQQWSAVANDWVNKSQVNYTYDSINYLSERVTQDWINSTSSWQDSLKSDYFYFSPSGIGEHPALQRPCIYSNPMMTGSPIYCPDFKVGDTYTLRVCSLSGLEVYRTTFNGGEAVTINRSLSPGLYFLIIEQNNTLLYKDKVVVL